MLSVDSKQMSGVALNQEEAYGVKNAITALTAEIKKPVAFWGKIEGKDADYYILKATSAEAGEFPSATFYYSVGTAFAFSEAPASAGTPPVASITGVPETVLVEESDESEAVTEAHYVCDLVSKIDVECSIVAKGTLTIDDGNRLVPLRVASVLSATDALRLDSFRMAAKE